MEPISMQEKKIYGELQIKINMVQMYEDESLLNDALERVPFEELSRKASVKGGSCSTEDLLILELLHWFRNVFFSWVNSPQCDVCSQPTVASGMVDPSPSELRWGTNRVELYACAACRRSIRFPRYNDPRKLLETRKGRCGEWANAFTLFCRALGYEARLVWDLAWDHVWTEVFSYAQHRWLHCDPCEDICDKPLIYEAGWKKNVSYVMAVSKDEVQDVTWRYTSCFADALSRRHLCREAWLTASLLSLSSILQATFPRQKCEELQKRRVLELTEFLTQPQVSGDTLGGRRSGAATWRVARGEAPTVQSSSFTFRPSEKELKNRCFHIQYSCASDKYVRISDASAEISHWECCAFEHSDVFRKTEPDWKMTYLARLEGSSKGHISWRFDFRGSGLVIHTLKLSIGSQTFESGVVRWLLLSNAEGTMLKEYMPEDVACLSCADFAGLEELVLRAELMGGRGDICWQHAQLFRQALDSPEFPFQVQITLHQKESMRE